MTNIKILLIKLNKTKTEAIFVIASQFLYIFRIFAKSAVFKLRM